ncbi:hypothetical protein FRX31_028170 [Thalictrum thalictroides]|uniref:RNase H type-1 domain-containing protein n=1 Tax=Thalictrum thalictroides TaxID=46969 RepID=A0A7J6VDF5_THATH|nr:hypothetical protein FRX31_028170 [Thalictrum thalictroides]
MSDKVTLHSGMNLGQLMVFLETSSTCMIDTAQGIETLDSNHLGKHIRPRHSFVLWLAIQDALPMQEKLVEWKKINISNYYLCSQELQAMDQTQMPIHYPNRSRPRARTVWYPEICNSDLFNYVDKAYSPSLQNWRALPAASSLQPTIEHTFHLFFNCPFSARLWGHVMEWCGVKRLVDQAPAEWIWIFHAFKGKSLKKLMIQSALAATVYWIWSERNARMYGGSIEQRPLFHLITRDVTLKLSALEKRHKDTPDNQFAAAIIGREDLITLLQWELPAKGWHALNSVGSLTSNKASYGGIIRDETGVVNLAFCASSNERSILYLELMGIAKGIEATMTLNISKLHIRTDSMMSTRILLKRQAPTWRTEALVAEINENLKSFNETKVEHTFRQVNLDADWVANLNSERETMYFIQPLHEELDNIVMINKTGRVQTKPSLTCSKKKN